jgi:hypothetical protein
VKKVNKLLTCAVILRLAHDIVDKIHATIDRIKESAKSGITVSVC